MRKVLAMIGTGLASVCAFAEGESAQILDPTSGIQAFTQLKTDLSTWSGSFLPLLLGLMGIFLVYWLIRFGLRMFKSFTDSAA